MKTQGGPKVEERLDVIADDLTSNPEAGWSKVFVPALRRALWVGVGLAVFQQVTGINAVIYYSDKIFAAAGFTTPEQQTHATLIAVGRVNVLATLIAVAWVDRFGRKPLLFAGLIGMTVGLVSIAGASPSSTRTRRTVAVRASSVSPPSSQWWSTSRRSRSPSVQVVWTMISEIFPSQVRGKAVAVCAAVELGSRVRQRQLPIVGRRHRRIRDVPPVRRDVRVPPHLRSRWPRRPSWSTSPAELELDAAAGRHAQRRLPRPTWCGATSWSCGSGHTPRRPWCSSTPAARATRADTSVVVGDNAHLDLVSVQLLGRRRRPPRPRRYAGRARRAGPQLPGQPGR